MWVIGVSVHESTLTELRSKTLAAIVLTVAWSSAGTLGVGAVMTAVTLRHSHHQQLFGHSREERDT
jgi:hypothetical protein